MVAEHYERYFGMNFHFKAAQNLVAEHYDRDFDMIFHLGRLRTWFQSTIKDIFTWFSLLGDSKHGCRAL